MGAGAGSSTGVTLPAGLQRSSASAPPEGGASGDHGRSHPEPSQATAESPTKASAHAVDELYAKLCVFYGRYAPERLTDSSLSVRNIAETYVGREEALNERLLKTYGVDLNAELVRDTPSPHKRATTVETEKAAAAEVATSAAVAAAAASASVPPTRKPPSAPPPREPLVLSEVHALETAALAASTAVEALTATLPPRAAPTAPPPRELPPEIQALEAAALAASTAAGNLAFAPSSRALPTDGCVDMHTASSELQAANAEEDVDKSGSSSMCSEESATRAHDGSIPSAQQPAVVAGGMESGCAEVTAGGERPGSAASDSSSERGISPALSTSDEYAHPCCPRYPAHTHLHASP